MIGYVTIKIQQSLLHMARIKCVPAGQRRDSENGTVEAEFLCIEPGSNCEKIWTTKEMVE